MRELGTSMSAAVLRACVRACVRACMHACVMSRLDYDIHMMDFGIRTSPPQTAHLLRKNPNCPLA
jgi:hypothetical protein